MWTLKRNHSHVNAETLSEYIDGRLTGSNAARVERQLSGCAACQEELESLRSTVGMLRAMREPAPRRSFTLEAPLPARDTRPRPRRSPVSLIPQWAYAGAAATAALVLALLVSADVTGLLAPGTDSMQEAAFESAASTVEEVVREVEARAQDQSAPTLGAPEGLSPGSAEPLSAPAAQAQRAPGQPPDKGDTPSSIRLASTARPEPASARAAQPEQVAKREVTSESAIVPHAAESAPPAKVESPAEAAPANAALPAPALATTAISGPTPIALTAQPGTQRTQDVMVAKEVDAAGTQTVAPAAVPLVAPLATSVPEPVPNSTPTDTPAPPTPTPDALPAPTKPTLPSEPTSSVLPATAIPIPMPTIIPERDHEQMPQVPPSAETGGQGTAAPDSTKTTLIWRILEGTAVALCLVFLAIFLIRLRAPGPTSRS